MSTTRKQSMILMTTTMADLFQLHQKMTIKMILQSEGFPTLQQRTMGLKNLEDYCDQVVSAADHFFLEAGGWHPPHSSTKVR